MQNQHRRHRAQIKAQSVPSFLSSSADQGKMKFCLHDKNYVSKQPPTNESFKMENAFLGFSRSIRSFIINCIKYLLLL